MSDQAIVHIGENSPEYVAYKLMRDIAKMEAKKWDRKQLLDLYAECLDVVQNPQARV
jgi:hypothetical protein